MKYFTDLIDAFAPAEGTPPRGLVPFVRWGLTGAWRVIGVAALFGCLAGVLEIVSAFLVGWVIDSALAHGGSDFVTERWPVLAAVALFFLLLRPGIMGLSAALNSLSVGPNLPTLILSRLHRNTLGQHLQFFDDDFAGRLSQKQVQVSSAVVNVASDVTTTIFFAITMLIGAAVTMATVGGALAVFLALWLAIYCGMVAWFIPRIRKRAKARAAARAAMSGRLVDTLTNMKTVKLFAHAAREEEQARAAMGELRDAIIHFGRLTTAFRVLLNIIAGALPVVMIGGVLMMWQTGGATAGDIATAGIISARIGQMTGWVSFTALSIFANIGEIEDGVQTLTPTARVRDVPGAPDLPPATGAIRFEDVQFHYGRGTGGGLDGLSFAVEPGEKVALVGASGAGKSTAMSLLLRLYDVEGGRITVDGHDVAGVSQESLRRQISMVTQETAMFNRSASENILYGNPEATEADMVAAARRAEAHGFIRDLRDNKGRVGYDAHLGERGVKLSGGQRQRIALARAILKDAPILLLDEATSALDSEVEADIQTALIEVMDGKTVIAIAHRLSTIAHMDRILVIEDGRLVEEGDHATLLALDGVYARFWNRQSGGFLNLEAAE
ncbi:MAG: ABC transporter ATP-binding protein [Pseudomonadota bacterium]